MKVGKVREIPILFSAPMVRANRAGRKWQTRRLVKHPEYYGCPTGDCPHWEQGACNVAMNLPDVLNDCRFKVGDTLWVREAFYVQPALWASCHDLQPIHYAADVMRNEVEDYVQKPSIHMPRWACRDTYTVTGVRAERLQDISEADAEAEGIADDEALIGQVSRPYATAYMQLFDKINGPGSAAANPLVWVIEYDNPQRKDEQ